MRWPAEGLGGQDDWRQAGEGWVGTIVCCDGANATKLSELKRRIRQNIGDAATDQFPDAWMRLLDPDQRSRIEQDHERRRPRNRRPVVVQSQICVQRQLVVTLVSSLRAES
jgi:hypothetical protein